MASLGFSEELNTCVFSLHSSVYGEVYVCAFMDAFVDTSPVYICIYMQVYCMCAHATLPVLVCAHVCVCAPVACFNPGLVG